MSEDNQEEKPTHLDLMWPEIVALKELGDSATNQEMLQRVIQDKGYSEEMQSVISSDGRRSLIDYRLHWARTYLKKTALISNSQRGVWSLTELGKEVTPDQIPSLISKWKSALKSNTSQFNSEEQEQAEEDVESSWKDTLLEHLKKMTPSGFERLTQRLLREAGFANVEVLGKSGDGGIDGVGIYRLSLVSFTVFFQCKRYGKTVAAEDVRDFRGAMAGRGEKGLLVTTGSFTEPAKKEASRDGATPIELIDGDRLCELLRDYGIGISVKEVVTQEVTIELDLFDSFDQD
jgi:restriction system protein